MSVENFIIHVLITGYSFSPYEAGRAVDNYFNNPPSLDKPIRESKLDSEQTQFRLGDLIPSPNPLPEEVLINKEEQEPEGVRFARVLNMFNLSPKQKQALMFKFEDDLNNDEIAQSMNLPSSIHANGLVSGALKRIRADLISWIRADLALQNATG